MVTINTPRELGQKYRKGFVLSGEIAGVRAIPESFVERILLTLRSGGVIVSVRGVKGCHVPNIKISIILDQVLNKVINLQGNKWGLFIQK